MILLEILKIIVIVLLVLVGIIIALILFLLLMNIKFRVKGKYDNGFDMNLYAEYIFKLVMFKFDMKNENGKYQLLIMGTDHEIWKRRREKLKKKFSKKKKQKKKDMQNTEDIEESVDISEEDICESVGISEEDTDKSEKSKKGINREKESIKDKIDDKIEFVKEKIEYMKEKYRKTKSFLQENDIKEIVKLTKELLIRLIKAFNIKKYDIYLKFGSNDPSQTGIIYGGICVVNTFIPIRVKIVPDFKNEVFETDFTVEGNTNLFKLIVPLVRYALAKPIFKIIKEL